MPNLTVTATAAAVAAGHSLQATESALLRMFCRQHDLAPQPDSLLGRLVTASDKDVDAAEEALTGLPELDLDGLVMAFETLVPAEEAKKYGAVFTPETITSFMANEAIDRAAALGINLDGAHVVDPAVGCGALLIAALRSLVERTGQAPHEVANRLYGSDISEDSVTRARLLLALACLYLGDEQEPDTTTTIVVADALLSDWNDVFGRDHFELVLGNPPYVRYQQLPEDLRDALAAKWASCGKGNFNLYFPFFEVAHTLADPAGSVISFITPNAFLSSMSGGLLRQWMTETKYLDDVVDFGHHRVFEALTYTSVTFAHRHPKRKATSFGYTAVNGLPGLAKLKPNWAAKDSVATKWAGLTAAPWRLVGKKAATATGKLTSAGVRLDSIADVRFGVATCRDKLYLLTGDMDSDGNYVKIHNKVTYRIEPGVTLACTRVSSIPTQAALNADKTRIIHPYTVTDGRATVLPEKDLAKKFPGAYAYLCAVRQDLESRDKGKKTYAAWYAYARTQGLAPSGDKLLTPLYAGKPRFMRDARTDSLFINGCSVTMQDTAPGWATLDLLSLILNSGVCHFFVESTANAIDGGFFAYQKTQLSRLGIPRVDAAEVDRVSALPAGEQDDAIASWYGIKLPRKYRRP